MKNETKRTEIQAHTSKTLDHFKTFLLCRTIITSPMRKPCTVSSRSCSDSIENGEFLQKLSTRCNFLGLTITYLLCWMKIGWVSTRRCKCYALCMNDMHVRCAREVRPAWKFFQRIKHLFCFNGFSFHYNFYKDISTMCSSIIFEYVQPECLNRKATERTCNFLSRYIYLSGSWGAIETNIKTKCFYKFMLL